MLRVGELRRAAEAIEAEFAALDIDENRPCLRAAPADLLAWRKERPRWQLYRRPPRPGDEGQTSVLARGVELEADAALTLPARLQELVQAERLGEARRIASALPPEQQDLRVKAWLHLLAVPEAHPTERVDADRSDDYAFLERESARLRGRWVAVAQGALIASEPTYEALLAHLEDGREPPPLVTFIPGPADAEPR